MIFNSKPGEDQRLLRMFGEPAWNYPVVRFCKADRSDLIPRIALVNRWTLTALATGMCDALAKAERPVPAWLSMLKTNDETAQAPPAVRDGVLKHVPMTGKQIKAVAERLAARKDYADLLSPRQLRIAQMAGQFSKAEWPVVHTEAQQMFNPRAAEPILADFDQVQAVARQVLANPDEYRDPDARPRRGSGEPEATDGDDNTPTEVLFPKGTPEYDAYMALLKEIVPGSHRALSEASVTESIAALDDRNRERMLQFVRHHERAANGDARKHLREVRKLLDTD